MDNFAHDSTTINTIVVGITTTEEDLYYYSSYLID